MEVEWLRPNLPVPSLIQKDLLLPTEVVIQHPSEEEKELPVKEDPSGTTKQRQQTQAIADASSDPTICCPHGQGIFLTIDSGGHAGVYTCRYS